MTVAAGRSIHAAEERTSARSGTGRRLGTDLLSSGGGESHPVHGALVRHVLTLGVERHVAALELTLCLAVVFGIGLSVPALCVVAVVALVIHPALVWITARDPLASEVYVRSRFYADYYAPHATAHAAFRKPAPRPRPSLPRPR